MSLVWESDLPPHETLILLALADHARDDGSRIYPSIATIARKTKYNRRTVQRIMRKLEEREILEVVKKSVRYGTTEYLIRCDKLPPLRGGKNDISDAVNSTFRGGQNSNQGRYSAAQSLLEPSLDTSVRCNLDSIPVERFG
jgi:Helix-turn-helix domain